MKITPLQRLLILEIRPESQIMQAVGRSRFAIHRWKKGENFPKRAEAEKLIEFYGRDNLDFNGCYDATVEWPDEA